MKKTLSITNVVVLFVSILLLEIIFRNDIGITNLFGSYLLYTSCFAFVLSSIMLLFGRVGRTIYSVLILVFIGGLFAAQSLHYDFFETFFSISKISIIQEFFQVSGETTHKMSLSLLIYFIPALVCLIIGLIKPLNEKISFKVRSILCSILLVIGVMGLLFIPQGYKDNKIMSKSNKLLYETLYNSEKAVDKLGFYAYTIKDVQLYLDKDNSSDENNKLIIDMYMQDNGYNASTNEYTNMFEGKNLILILCESLSPIAINEDLTPTLYKLQREGINFSNHYAPVFQTATSDSEYISLTGLLPSILDGPISYDFANNSFPMALPWKFRNLGYSANSFHSFKKSFYNREQLHYTYGFTYLYDWEDLNFYKKPEFVEAMNWVADKDLMSSVVKISTDLEQEPFFDFVISVSGHIPYIRGRYELESDLWETIKIYGEVGETYSEEALCYLGAQRTLESGIEELINDLEKEGLLGDTVIALYGDHYPYGLTKEASKELFGENIGNDIYKTPFIIWTPGIEHKEVTDITSTFDIYPTLANLFGLDINGQMIIGRDALSGSEGLVIFQDYSWKTNDGYYDATKQVFSTSNLNEDDIEEINDKVFNLIMVGQNIIREDYFRN
ncbi:MAG: sulfatase-like hydrolase/transferase [Bacilli bacterium]|uniref:LTA synthase family protein n=1 Tax=Anaerorhabdus sp. TaxID=1872524 RepID=UPI002FC8A2FA